MPRPAAKKKPPRPRQSKPRSAAPKPAVGDGAAPAVQALVAELEALVAKTLPEAIGNAYGGAKVRLKLFSIGGTQHVVCGVQPRDGACLFYLHHIRTEDSKVLTIEGQGKHALHVRLTELTPAIRKELARLIKLAANRLKTQ